MCKKKPKIWICGSVASKGEEENIRELVKTFDCFDGAIFSVNYDTVEDCKDNETYDLLDKCKKLGRIMFSPWLRRHDHAMNNFLLCPLIKEDDYLLSIDAQELPKPEFLTTMRQFVEECSDNDVGSIWWNRPYIIRKKHGICYKGQPHCWPYPLNGKYINIADESKVTRDEGGTHFGDFIYNKKKKENTMLLSGVKYSLYDPPNNQFDMFYKDDALTTHEEQRMWFCGHLESLGYQRDLIGLEEFLRKEENITEEIRNYLNWEWVFRDFYRYRILGHSIDEIMVDRYTYRLSYE